MNSNLRFVFQIAKSYKDNGIDLDDLISEGNLGLIKAYERFDLDKNVKFISYAVWWIRQSILNTLYVNSSSIRLPLNKLVNVNKISKIRETLKQDLLRDPTKEEIIDALDDPTMITDLDHLHTIISLDENRSEGGDANLHSVIESIKEEPHEKKFENFEHDLKSLLKNCPPREIQILCMYYGVGYDRSYNLREIGDELNLTRERIRQIKEYTIERLKKRSDTVKLIEYL